MSQVKDRKEYHRSYYLANKARYQDHAKRWWKEHPEQRKAKAKRKYLKYRDRDLLLKKERRLKNLEKYRACNRKWHHDNREHRRRYMRTYYDKNAEKLRQRTRDWYRANKARHWNQLQKRRSLKEQATVNLEVLRKFTSRIKAKRFAFCYWCGEKTKTSAIHFDHIIPLIKGGQHSVENLCVSCARCNLRKNDSLPSDWILRAHKQYLFDL